MDLDAFKHILDGGYIIQSKLKNKKMLQHFCLPLFDKWAWTQSSIMGMKCMNVAAYL